MRQVAFSLLNSVASLLISRATTEKSAFYFSDSPLWFSGTMPSYCMTVLWRRRRSKVHSSLIFVLFLYCIAYFFHSLGIEYRGQKNNNNDFLSYLAIQQRHTNSGENSSARRQKVVAKVIRVRWIARRNLVMLTRSTSALDGEKNWYQPAVSVLLYRV